MGHAVRTGYLTDVSDEEWAFVLPYLLLSREDNRSRVYELRAVFNAVRYVVKGGNQWRLLPNDLPPGVGSPKVWSVHATDDAVIGIKCH